LACENKREEFSSAKVTSKQRVIVKGFFKGNGSKPLLAFSLCNILAAKKHAVCQAQLSP
jgi:hypothetical protein